jgi:hypothetical protein
MPKWKGFVKQSESYEMEKPQWREREFGYATSRSDMTIFPQCWKSRSSPKLNCKLNKCIRFKLDQHRLNDFRENREEDPFGAAGIGGPRHEMP